MQLLSTLMPFYQIMAAYMKKNELDRKENDNISFKMNLWKF